MGKKEDLPAMPFYIGDWKKDPAVQVLTKEQKMIWFEMLMLMWESKERGYLTINGKPIKIQLLEIALNLVNQNLSKTLVYFEELDLYSKRESDGAIYSRRMIKLIELSNKRKSAGKKGGSPVLLNQSLTKSEAKGLPITENENENENEIESKDGNGKSIKKASKKYPFEELWARHPKKLGKTEALGYFNSTVNCDEDWKRINKAMSNFLNTNNVIDNKVMFIQKGCNWFAVWEDWVDYQEPRIEPEDKKEIIDYAAVNKFIEMELGKIAKPEKIEQVMRGIPESTWNLVDKFLTKRYSGSSSSIYCQLETKLTREKHTV